VTPAPAAGAGRTIIIGAGQAGLQVAVELRQAGYAGAVTLVGEEAAQPYHRPPLSKAYLTGEKSLDALQMRGQAFYGEQAITFMAGLAATGIDRTARQVVLADGSTLPYDHLVLATGAAARPLSCPGHDLDGVMVLRSLEDATALKARLATARHLVVVGGGFIGLEAAASARKLGVAVSLLEMQDRLMARAIGPDVSQHFASVHRSHGVDLRLGQGIAAVIGDAGRTIAVRTTAGDTLPADIVLAGIGVTPNTALAVAAHLPVSNGIVVDEAQRTSDPRIHALGDVCAFPAPHGAGLIRLESVQNAVDQAKIVAASIMGQPARYQSVPWFWSDQYDLKLQMVGLSQGHDAVIERGSRDENRFSVFYMKAGRLIAIDSINRPADHMRGRKLLAPGAAPVGADEIDTHFAARRD
jgi:3-phenylpropionate/trans-cinnamate dioxygenase ferredoxin reductase component